MKILCITDPLTHLPSDSTFELYGLFPEDPRFELFHLEAGRLGDGFGIPVTRVSRALAFEEFLGLAQWPVHRAEFADFELAFPRADLPFPPGYLDTLIRHENDTRFVTRPSSMLAYGDRVFCRSVAGGFMPPGILTRSIEEAEGFIRRNGRVVTKRNRSYGGKHVTKLWRAGAQWRMEGGGGTLQEHGSIEGILEMLFASDPEPFEFVRYLERVTMGDKRVLVVDGAIYGCFLRVATDGGWINNISSGGISRPTTVTPREEEIIMATCQQYHECGLYALGYDFLMDDSGEWILSEINSGNTGGFGEAERTSGQPVYPRLLDWLATFPER